MASSHEQTGPTLLSKEEHVLQKGAKLMQSLASVKQMKQHECSFALYSHYTRHQIETHHYLALARLNQDFLQRAVYDADDHHANLIAYMPHLSILCGDLTDEVKKKAQGKANELDGSLNGLSFLISRLALYKTDTEDKTCQSWEKIAECSLSTS